MKKIISLLMAVIFVFSMAAPSFAAVAANEATVQSEVVYEDVASDTNDFLGKLVEILNKIWAWIVNFFKTLFGFGFNPGTYTVTYYTDSTKTEVLYKVPCLEGDEIPEVAVPTKVGYTFKSWVPALPSVMPAEDIEVYATWSVKTVTIKFVTGIAGVTVPDIIVTYGTTVDLPEVPGVNEYTLECWYYPNGVAVAMPNGQIQANDNYVMTAGWGQKKTVMTFNPNGGYWNDNPADTNIKYITQATGSIVNAPSNPTREGYIFEGWDGVVPEKQPSENITFTAVWTPRDITTTWVSNGKVLGTQTTKCGSDLNPNAAPVPDAGFKFIGWESSTDGKIYSPYDFPIPTPSRNTTFTAAFEAIEYNYTFLNENGNVITSGKASTGATIEVPAAPAKTGHTFVGWTDTKDNIVIGAAATATTMIAGDQTFIAKYSANVHDITWDANGGTFADGTTVKTASAAYGTAIAKPAKNPTMPGYVFNGWEGYTANMIMPDKALTFTAKWALATDTKYAVETYTMGTDGKYAMESEDGYGVTNAPVSVTPEELEGFTFNASKSVLSGVIAADGSTVLKVYYDRNKYDLYTKADADAEPVKVKTYYYGETIAYPAAPVKAGNTFAGWIVKPEGDKMPAADVTLTATWNLNSYTITYKTAANDANPIVVTYKYGTKIMPLGAPANEGYYFEGWMDEATGNVLPETMPDFNIVAIAKFTKVVTCTVTYKANGGIFEGTGNTVTETLSVDYGSATPVPEKAPVKLGYKFIGWYEESDTEKANIYTSDELKSMVVKGNLVYVAEYVETFDLAFEAGEGYWPDGEAQEKIKYLEAGLGEVPEVAAPTAPEGKVFVGWAAKPEVPFEDVAAAVAKVAPLEAVTGTSSREFVAVYVTDKFVINYKHDGALILIKEAVDETPAEYLAQTLKYGEAVEQFGREDIPETVIDSKKYVFEGWTPEVPEVINFETLAKLTVAYGDEENVIEFASVVKAAKYNIMYVGADKAAITVAYGASVPEEAKAAPAAREGYTFNGWLAAKDADEKTKAADNKYYVFPVTMPDSNIVLYPDWSINKYTFTVDYNGGLINGEESKTYANTEYGTILSAYLPAETPLYSGMVFGGWKWTDASGAEIESLTKMPDHDVTITAIWSADTFKVTFKANGGSIDGKNELVETYEYNKPITPPTANRTGWTFNGWSVSPADSGISSITNGTLMPPCDVVATAQWVQNNYTLTWLYNDGVSVYKEETLHYGDKINLPDEPTKEGHTFVGWEGYTAGMTMPTKNLTLKAKFDVNQYKITYYHNGLPAEWIAEFGGEKFKTDELDNVYSEQKVNYGEIIEADVNKLDYAPGYKVSSAVIEGTNTAVEGTVMGAKDINVLVNWGLDTYTAKFDGNGGLFIALDAEGNLSQVKTHEVANIPYTTKIGTIYNPGQAIKAGYTFDYWYRLDANGNEVKVVFAPGSDTETMPNADTTYYAHYTPKQYSVTYKVVRPSDNKVVEYRVYESLDCGSTIPVPESPVYYEGDDFQGYQMPIENGKPVWVDGANVPMADGAKVPAYNVTFFAYLVPINYKVSFNAGDGEFSDGKKIKYVYADYDSYITAPENPTRLGYKFNGWAPEVGKLDQANNNKIFTATWTVDGNKEYKITTTLEGQAPTTVIKNDGIVGQTVSVGPTEIEGYTFDAANSVLSGVIPATGVLELKLVYTKKAFTVKTNVQGVETILVGEGAYKYGDVLAEPATPDLSEQPSKEFLGWYTDAACTEEFIAGTPVTSDMVLYAKIQTKRFTVEITSVTGLDNPYAAGVEYGTKIDVSKLATPAAPAGKTFKEWAIMTESGAAYDPAKGATENILLMPIFE